MADTPQVQLLCRKCDAPFDLSNPWHHVPTCDCWEGTPHGRNDGTEAMADTDDLTEHSAELFVAGRTIERLRRERDEARTRADELRDIANRAWYLTESEILHPWEAIR